MSVLARLICLGKAAHYLYANGASVKEQNYQIGVRYFRLRTIAFREGHPFSQELSFCIWCTLDTKSGAGDGNRTYTTTLATTTSRLHYQRTTKDHARHITEHYISSSYRITTLFELAHEPYAFKSKNVGLMPWSQARELLNLSLWLSR